MTKVCRTAEFPYANLSKIQREHLIPPAQKSTQAPALPPILAYGCLGFFGSFWRFFGQHGDPEICKKNPCHSESLLCTVVRLGIFWGIKYFKALSWWPFCDSLFFVMICRWPPWEFLTKKSISASAPFPQPPRKPCRSAPTKATGSTQFLGGANQLSIAFVFSLPLGH